MTRRLGGSGSRSFRHRRGKERSVLQAQLADGRGRSERRVPRCARRVLERFAQSRWLPDLFPELFRECHSCRDQLYQRVPGQRRKQPGGGGRHFRRRARFCRHCGACSIRRPAPMVWATSTPRFTAWRRPRRTRFMTSRPATTTFPALRARRDVRPAAPFQYGFSAGAGYDQVTGLGSVNVTNLANAWAALYPQPGFFAFWVLRHSFSSRPVRHFTDRGGIKRRLQRDRGPHVPAGFDQCANHLHDQSHFGYG